MQIPGPAGRDMIASLGAIRRDPLGFLRTTRDRYGPVVAFPTPKPAYLIDDPEATRRVLVTNSHAYGKATPQYATLSLVTGDGLLTVDGPEWRAQRAVVQPAFHREALGAVDRHIDDCVGELGNRWNAQPPGTIVDVDEAMMHLALDIVGRALFGSDLGSDAAALTGATLAALEVVVKRVRNPLAAPLGVPTPGNMRLHAAVRRLDKAVAAMLEHRRRDTRARPPDMLDLLIADQPDHVVRDQIITFIVAGHETVASALTWSWYLLGRNPHVSDHLRADPHGGAPAVFDEVLRLYPPAWLITRRVLESDVLGGYEIPRGALLIISPWLLHRGAGWTRPDEFDPQRFSQPSASRIDYLPFGAGSRLCIGREMALHEGVRTLTQLAARFDLTPVRDAEVPAQALVTLRPRGGLPMRVSPIRPKKIG